MADGGAALVRETLRDAKEKLKDGMGNRIGKNFDLHRVLTGSIDRYRNYVLFRSNDDPQAGPFIEVHGVSF
jgi:hypothetical protein